MTLRGRDFLAEIDFSQEELTRLLDLSAELKSQKRSGSERHRLSGRSIALIFEKTSTRTRVAFEVAAYDQGAHVTFLDGQSSQIGHKESVADTARVLSRFFDAIQFRGYSQSSVQELADYADVPVYNGLTDEWHPTQMLADFLTMSEHSVAGGYAPSYAYVGDARFNMGNSLLVTGAIMGADVRIVSPRSLWPSIDVQNTARALAEKSGATITLTEDPSEGLKGAEFVHTDVWVSMGETADVWAERIALLRPYQVNEQLMALTGRSDSKFMHCLPAYHDTKTEIGRSMAEQFGMDDGIEVTNDVFESPACIVFDQAENRLHTIKAVMVATIGDE